MDRMFDNMPKSDPLEFIDSEIIKASLQRIEAVLERIEENLGTNGKNTKRRPPTANQAAYKYQAVIRR